MFFDSWTSIGRVLLAGAFAYVALVFLVRVSGKRTLAKLNAFDLVVTVALGSTLSSVLTSKQLSLVSGVTALATLIALQYAVAWGASRSRRFDSIVKASPRVLFHAGTFARDAMKDERITEDEIRAAVRQAELGHMDDVESVVLESSGDLFVIRASTPRRHPDLPRRSQEPPNESPSAV